MIEEHFLDKHELVFVGPVATEACYVNLFASYPVTPSPELHSLWLELSPLENKTTWNDEKHILFVFFVFTIYKKSFENVVAIIGDNCTTNQCIAIKLRLPLIGYTSNRFQIGV